MFGTGIKRMSYLIFCKGNQACSVCKEASRSGICDCAGVKAFLLWRFRVNMSTDSKELCIRPWNVETKLGSLECWVKAIIRKIKRNWRTDFSEWKNTSFFFFVFNYLSWLPSYQIGCWQSKGKSERSLSWLCPQKQDKLEILAWLYRQVRIHRETSGKVSFSLNGPDWSLVWNWVDVLW